MKPADDSVLRFRPIGPEDQDLLFAQCFGHPEVTKHLQWDTHLEINQTRALITEMTELHAAQEKYFWAALATADNRLAGIGSIKPEENTAWIGFLVLADRQGKGLGARILSALEQAVFAKYDAASAATEAENLRSIQLLRKAGWEDWQNEELLPLIAFRKRLA